MRLAIMQPYFLPYIGYWQLLAAVNACVVYDNIKYTKKGWINRNRFLQNGRDVLFTIPLMSGSDSLDIKERTIAPDFRRGALLSQIANAYRKAPHFSETFPLIEECVNCQDTNLFDYLLHSIALVAAHLGIWTQILPSSTLGIDHKPFRAQEKVLAICRHLRVSTYINLPGGKELYDRPSFAAVGVQLRFLAPRLTPYQQSSPTFCPALSVIDALMFVGRDAVQGMVHNPTFEDDES